jgi:MFS family permease
MMRRFGLSIGEAGFYSGVIASLPAALSVIGSGWLADRLGARSQAAYALVPAVCLLIGGPLYAFAITRDELVLLLSLVSIATFLNFGYLGVTFAALQNLMHPRMRATASALLNVVYGIASALGPFLLGVLSDGLGQTRGEGLGLAMAMALAALLYLWAGLHYLLAARRLGADTEAMRAAAG